MSIIITSYPITDYKDTDWTDLQEAMVIHKYYYFLMLVLSCFVGLTECLCNTGWPGYKCLVKVTDSDFSVI